jgi:hypothetical protein
MWRERRKFRVDYLDVIAMVAPVPALLEVIWYFVWCRI